MKIGQKSLKDAVATAVVLTGIAASANATPVTVTDVTDWGTTPMEVVNITDPYLGYNGGVYAGINTLSVQNGATTTVYNGFCIDPFHWSVSGPQPYSMVPLIDAPKSPATLNAATATDIEDLMTEYYSPHMSSTSAAGLQIAIWELVSSNAVATDGLPANEAFSLANGQFDYGASTDLASLATYDGPAPGLLALTGPGQDYLVTCPDGGETFLMLALTAAALIVAKPTLMKRAAGRLAQCPVAVARHR